MKLRVIGNPFRTLSKAVVALIALMLFGKFLLLAFFAFVISGLFIFLLKLGFLFILVFLIVYVALVPRKSA